MMTLTEDVSEADSEDKDDIEVLNKDPDEGPPEAA